MSLKSEVFEKYEPLKLNPLEADSLRAKRENVQD